LFLQRSRQLTDKGFANLTRITGLRKLHLNWLHLSDTQMSLLKKFRNLELIQLDTCDITSAGLKNLESMTWLKKINLSHSPTLTANDVDRLKSALPKKTWVIDNNMQLYSRDSNGVSARVSGNDIASIDERSGSDIGRRAGKTRSQDEKPIDIEELGKESFEYSKKSRKYWSNETTDDVVAKLVAQSGPLIHKIQFRESRVSPAGYALLNKSPLTFLEFEDSRITKDVLKSIGNLPELQTVVFKMCPEIDFSHFTELNLLKNLHELIIEGSKLSKSDITNIAKVHSIQQLKLDYCTGLTRENLAPLTGLPKLGALHMVATDFGNSGFSVMKHLSLGTLVISGTNISKDALGAYLRSGSKPVSIELTLSNSITAADLHELKKIRSNVQLSPVRLRMNTDMIFIY